MTRKFVQRIPGTFYINVDDSLVCQHRDISCCNECEAKYENIVEIYGQHYWADTRAQLVELESIGENL